MEHQNIPDRVIKRIQDLMNLAKANDTQASKGEIEQASALLRKILMEHNLEEDKVHLLRTEKERQIDVTEQYFDLNKWQQKTDGNWVMQLFWTIAKANMCRAIHYKKNRKPYDQGDAMVIGTAFNIELTHYTIDQLESKIRDLNKNAFKEYTRNGGTEKANTFRRGFCSGVVDGIRLRLTEEETKLIEGYRGLIVRNTLAVEQYMEKIRTKSSKAPALKGREARGMGINIGRNMNISTGIGQKRLN